MTLNDVLADGREDGAFDAYTMLVMVGGGSPLPPVSVATVDESGSTASPRCYDQTSASDLAPINCVDDFGEIGSDDEHCATAGSDHICTSVDANQHWSKAPFGSSCVTRTQTLSGLTGNVSASSTNGMPGHFCTCGSDWDTRYANGLVLGAAGASRAHPSASDELSTILAAEATCSIDAPVSCGMSTPCGKLQLVYEQLCILKTEPTTFPTAAVVAPILTVLLIAGAYIAYARRKAKRKVARLREELEGFKNTVIGVLAATDDFDPRAHPGYRSQRVAKLLRAAGSGEVS